VDSILVDAKIVNNFSDNNNMRVMIEKKDYLFTKKVWIQLKRYKYKSIKLLVSGGADSLALLLAVFPGARAEGD
jgi:hypothetical protein